jgi:hypothetical protein
VQSIIANQVGRPLARSRVNIDEQVRVGVVNSGQVIPLTRNRGEQGLRVYKEIVGNGERELTGVGA